MADFDTVRRKRLEELEQKKKRLEEMRRNKKDRENDDVNSVLNISKSSSTGSTSTSSSSNTKRAEVDDLVKSLLGPSIQTSTIAPSNSEPEPSTVKLTTIYDENGLCVTCRKSEHHVLPIPPVEAQILTPQHFPVECYDKNTQTESDDFDYLTAAHSESEVTFCASCRNSSTGLPSPQRHRRRAGSANASTSAGAIEIAEDHEDQSETKLAMSSKNAIIRSLTQQESLDILESPAFADFLARSVAVVEKLLIRSPHPLLPYVDPMKDYRGGTTRGGNDGSCLAMLATISDEALVGRAVTSINFSPHHAELFCASYGASHEESSSGAVFVYSTAYLGRPEFRLGALSPVLIALFHPQDPHLLVCGCYSGQICIWDMRACKHGNGMEKPSQRSNMSGKGHKHPVYSMFFALPGAGASSSSLELVSVSSDGQICHWDLLSPGLRSSSTIEPIFISTLQVSNDGVLDTPISGSSTQCPAISAMTFSQHPGSSESRECVVGTGTGQLYRFPVPYNPCNEAVCLDAHSGLVTAMHLHPSSTRSCRNLMLTASLDWTTKLWNVAISNHPILEFRTSTYDYVCDVAWSPTHLGMFATVCTSGTIFIWNLSRSVSEPWDSFKVAANGASSALNKLSWSKDGRFLIVGDCGGVLHVIALTGNVSPDGGDEGRFELAVSSSAALCGDNTHYDARTEEIPDL